MANTSELEDDERSWKKLRELLNERIREGLEGNVSNKTVSEIVDEELSSSRPE